MQIQKISTQPNIYLHKDAEKPENTQVKNPAFTGAMDGLSSFLSFLDTNPAVGTCVVDLGSMVIPRTTVDFINRGPSAGAETARREATGTTNHSTVGLDGFVVGSLLATGLNSKYGIKAHKIFADEPTINILTKNYHDAVHSSNPDTLKAHIDTFVDRIRVFNTDRNNKTGFVEIPEADKKAIKDKFYEVIKKAGKKSVSRDDKKALYTMITAATGGEKEVLLKGFENAGMKDASNTLRTLITNFCNITHVCESEKVNKVFKETPEFAKNAVVKSLKKLNLSRTVGGLAIASAIGMSTQPINMYLTKKKTGQDGFPADPDRKKDKSGQFKLKKIVTAAIFALGALSTITTKPSKFLSKIQFQGMLPSLDQLKLVYGLTITSRLLVARDKDELREAFVKDTLGFLNLLILGSLVTKGAARLIDKNLFNKIKLKDSGLFKNKTTLKTRDEVMLPMFKKHGINVFDENGKVLSFRKMLKLVKQLPMDEQKALKKQLAALDVSQITGYLYSGIVLGVLIPKLNIYMTNKAAARRKAEAEKLKAETGIQQVQEPVQNVEDNKDTKLVPNFSSNTKHLSFEDSQYIIK